MKISKIFFTSFLFLIIPLLSSAQDKRTTETKVADLLARMPSNDAQFTNRLMTDILATGEAGIIQICDQVVPAGTGDDTRPRFAIESLSRFLSGNSITGKEMWEDLCIRYTIKKADPEVTDFFMKQLQVFGGMKSAEAVKPYLFTKELCSPALAVITAAGGKNAETLLAEALKGNELQCPAAVMNSLAAMKSGIAVNDYIRWSSSDDINTKASAFNALAMSGSKEANEVL